MPSIILNNISKPISLTDIPETTPLSFSEWTTRNTGIGFSDVESQYAKYVQSFRKDIEERETKVAAQLKEDYTTLLKRLQVIFQDDEEFERYRSIDLGSETNLALIIPAYARKLKDIALFYSRKREELKHKKLEYNLVGSYDGLSQLLYSNLVSRFTNHNYNSFTSDNPLITSSPEFSAIAANLSIEVEELYDTTDYYKDLESVNPFTCLFDGICRSIISTPLSAKADPIENNYLCFPSKETVDDLLFRSYAAYLSTDTRYVSGGYYVENYKTFNIPFEKGNNFFYWFSGKTVFDIPEGNYKGIPINSMTWTDAHGNSAFDVSDLVFVNAGNALIKGAWLQDTKYVTVSADLHATITDGKIFKFPYPDFGTSAVGGDWSGPGLDDTSRKTRQFFPTEEDFTITEGTINSVYWNSFSSLSTVHSIYLQETDLGRQGTASSRYMNADKVFVTDQNDETILYSGERRVAWLYDFRQTQIPIVPGENKIYFPLQRYEKDNELFFHFKKGEPVALSSVSVPDSFVGAVAGETLEDADLMVRNKSICGPRIEMAWLKAVPLRYYNNSGGGPCNCDPDLTSHYTGWQFISGGMQPGVSFKCDSNNYQRFVWTGETTSINKVRGFTGFAHDDTCPYKRLDHSVSIADTNFLNTANREIFEKWDKCTCQAIQYSPFGHNHTNVDAYSTTPDFIVRDTTYPSNFNKKSWQGRDRKDYRTSEDFARFFPQLIEKDVGWGKGSWKSQTGGDFILEKGVSYIYYRADTNNCTFRSPYFIINDAYPPGTAPDDNCVKGSYYPVWMKATQDVNGKWVDAGVRTDMVMEFGDFLNYTHRPAYAETRQQLLYNGTEIASVSGDYITVLKDDPAVAFTTITNSIPSVNFLMKIPVRSETNFWGKGDHGADNSTTKQTSVNSFEFRIVNEYLQMTQPPASDIVLGEGSIMEYQFGVCNGGCFVWNENLKFEVFAPVRKWNQIIFDDCVQSEILTYLNHQITDCYLQEARCLSDCSKNRSCGCENYCNPTKQGLTATSVDSDITFNTELSGIPLFINYFARKAFDQEVTVQDITDGEKSLLVPVVTGNYVDAENPWRNLTNQIGSNFITEENTDNLRTVTDLNFYHPGKIGMGRYETHDPRTIFTPGTSGMNVYRTDNYFDAPFAKAHTNSSYVTDYTLGKNQGRINGINRQTFTPYTTVQEKSHKGFYGLFNEPLQFSPWNQITGKWEGGDIYTNFRNQHSISGDGNWFTQQAVLTGDVWNWDTDIYGNQYFDMRSDISYDSIPSTYAKVFVKFNTGKVVPLHDAIESFTTVYENITLDIHDEFAEI